MKRYIVILALMIFALFGCKEKKKYVLKDVVVYSAFDKSSFSISLPIIDVEDGQNTANFFYCNLSIDEMSTRLDCLEKSDTFLRFFSSNNYYYLTTSNLDDNQYKLISDSLTYPLVEEQDQVYIPFPRNFQEIFFSGIEFDEEMIEYLKDYYGRLGIVLENDIFDLGIYKSAKGELYHASLSLNEGIKVVKSND